MCGAYLSRLDNDRRLADHFYGKMHLGYAQMRKTWEGLQKELKEDRRRRGMRIEDHQGKMGMETEEDLAVEAASGVEDLEVEGLGERTLVTSVPRISCSV